MASVRACLCEDRGWGTVLLFTYFYSRPRPTAIACYLAKTGYLNSTEHKNFDLMSYGLICV